MTSMAAFLFQNAIAAQPFGEAFVGATLSVKDKWAVSVIWV